jgi:hypothetical protein
VAVPAGPPPRTLNVVIAGGFDGTNLPAGLEIYSVSTNSSFFVPGPNLNVPRFGATSTVLNNGTVLIAGGSTCALLGCPTNAAEIYDPVANTVTATSGMNVSRFAHSATQTTNGNVVFAGGYSACSSTCTAETTTEVFDPTVGSFNSGAVAEHSGTLLANGNVLLIGGIDGGASLGQDQIYQTTTSTPEAQGEQFGPWISEYLSGLASHCLSRAAAQFAQRPDAAPIQVNWKSIC